MTDELFDVIKSVEVGVYLLPVHAEVLVREHIPEAGQRCQFAGKVRRQNPQFALTPNRLIVVLRLGRALERDNAIANINAALGSYLQVALDRVPQIGLLLKRRPILLLKRA